METDEIAGVDDVQPIGIQRSLQHSHFNWMLGCDIALANVDDRFPQAALIAGRRIQLNVAIELESLTFGIVDAGDRGQLHRTLVLHFDLGANVAQLDDVRLCHILRSRVSCEFVGAGIAREPGQPRLFHCDLRT